MGAMTLASIVGDLLLLAAMGAINEFVVHLFVKERLIYNGGLAIGVSVVTVIALFSFVPELKDLMRSDLIDYTKTFFVAGLLAVMAIGIGAYVSFLFSRPFISWHREKMLKGGWLS
jgi:hypothetical protein